MHASTFSGNALTMAAGLAAMQNYDQDQAARINELGEQLREGFNGVFRQAGLRARAMGKGSLTNVLFTDGPVNNARDFIAATLQAGHIPKLLHLTMLRHGVMSATRLRYCTSTAMDSGEIQQAINAMAASVEELAPYIAAERPGLLAV